MIISVVSLRLESVSTIQLTVSLERFGIGFVGLKTFDAVLEEGVSNHLSDESGKFKGEVNGLNGSVATPLDLVVVVLVFGFVAVAKEGDAFQEKDASESDDIGPHDSSSDVREDNMHDGHWDEGHSPED